MPEQFLHGIELLEVTDGPRSVRTVRSSVIGLVVAAAVGATLPSDTPLLITRSRLAEAKLSAGAYGKKALDGIFKQAGAVVVLVLTADVEGDVAAGTGIFALKGAQSTLNYTPRVLVAEGAADEAIVTNLKSVAQSLRATCAIGLNVATAEAATDWVTENGNERTYALWPFVNGGEDPAPLIAGAIARSDNDRGFWWSPSNFEVLGISSLDHPVDFQLGDPFSMANILNEGGVNTFIREGGFRLWGNRTGSVDPKWAFLCVRRTGDIMNDSLQRAHMWAIDRPITKTYLADVAESVNGYLSTLVSLGAIVGGKCWADPDLNDSANVPQGKSFFIFDWCPTYPAEHITFSSVLDNGYIDTSLF